MFRYISLFVVTLSFVAVQAAYAASVSVVDSGNSSYTIWGNVMDGVTGIELNIAYDSASLATPDIVQGGLISGAMMVANTTKPGNIKVAIISARAFAGSGQIINVNFASRSGSGGITVVSAKMIDINRAAVASSAAAIENSAASSPSGGTITSPGLPFSQTASKPGPTQSTLTSPTKTVVEPTTTYGQSISGTVSLPSDFQPKSEIKPAEAEIQQNQPSEPPPRAQDSITAEKKDAKQPKAVESKLTSHESILNRFKEYKGEKSPAQLTALFNKQIAANIQQKPSVALSDGTMIISVNVKLDAVTDNLPNVALNGALLKSLRWNEADSSLSIEALPEAGVVEFTLIFLSGSEIIEYPLTVAPYVKGLVPTAEGFAAFLKAAPAKRDLNGDGRYDYFDDYVFTANYLARQSVIKPAPATKLEQQAVSHQPNIAVSP